MPVVQEQHPGNLRREIRPVKQLEQEGLLVRIAKRQFFLGCFIFKLSPIGIISTPFFRIGYENTYPETPNSPDINWVIDD